MANPLPYDPRDEHQTQKIPTGDLSYHTRKMPVMTNSGLHSLLDEMESMRNDMIIMSARLDHVTKQIKPLLEVGASETEAFSKTRLQLALTPTELMPSIEKQPTIILRREATPRLRTTQAEPVLPTRKRTSQFTPPGGTLPAHASSPSRPTLAREKESEGTWRRRIAVTCIELSYLIMAGLLGGAIYLYMKPWPIYQIVAFVCLGILWANFATAAARQTSTKRQATQLVKAVKHATTRHKSIKQIINEDTTTFLKSVRNDTLRSMH